MTDFESCLCFDGANLVDCIRQKVIDINNDPSLEEITYFLNVGCKYLEKDLPQDVANELYSAIFTFFTKFTKELMPIFNDIFKKARKNANYIYITSLLLSYLTNIDLNINITDYYSFISDAIKEICPQITNQQEKLEIFGQQIAPQFQNSLILNIILSSNLTETVSSKLFNYIFLHYWQKNDKKFDSLLLHIIKFGLNTILPQTQSSNEEILEFLSKKDDQFFLKMSKESFSVIKSAILYIKYKSKVQIEGLDEQSIFQFTAVISVLLRFLSKSNKYQFVNEIDVNLFKNAARLMKNNDSSNTTKLINIVLTNWPFLCLTKFFSFEKTLDFLNILIEQLINNEYKADKFILLNLYLNSINKIKPENSYQLSNLFSFIFSNFKAEEFYNFAFMSFDLKYVNPELIINQFENIKSKEEIIPKIYFYIKICFNQTLITTSKILFPQLLMQSYDQQMQNKNINNAMLIYKFLESNNFDDEIHKILVMNNIPFIKKIDSLNVKQLEEEKIDIDELLFNLLAVNELEDAYNLLLKLFKIMMKDEDNLFCYLSYLVSQTNNNFNIREYFKFFYNEYNQYHDMLLKVTNELFTYFSSQKILVVNNNFLVKNYKISEFGRSIVSKVFTLLKENPVCNYQAFFCLKSIACTVPILFNSNIQQVFDSILEPFNNLYLLFENNMKDAKTILLTKTAYASLSFLLSTFYSSLVLDHFVKWFFVNIDKFSNSQIFGFIYILRCLNTGNNVFYSFVPSDYKKYDLFNKVAMLLNRKITEGPNFEANFKENLLCFLGSVLETFSKFTPYAIAQNDVLSEFENKFTFFYSKIFSSFIRYTNLYIIAIDKDISNFIRSFEHKQNFWINFDLHDNIINEQQFKEFCDELPDNEEFIIPDNVKTLIKPISIRMAKYISMKPYLIYGIFLFPDNYVYSQKVGDLFMETMKKLKEFQKQALENPQDEDDSDIEKLNKIDYFTPLICQPEFIKSFVNQIAKSEINIKTIFIVFQYMNKYPLVIKKILEFVGLKMTELANNPSVLYDFFTRIKRLALYQYCNKSFIDLYGNNLLNTALLPKCRNDEILLKVIAEYLILLETKLPIRVIHLISFLIQMNSYELTKRAIMLCRHFDNTELGYASDSLLNILEKECLNTDNINFELLSTFAKFIPSLLKLRKAEVFSILIKEFENYPHYIDGSNEEKRSFNLICYFLNATAPNRSDSTALSSIIDSSTKIPSFIKDTNPKFWILYEKHMELMNEKLMKDPMLLNQKLRFLLNYPEIVDFKVRSSYFKNLMKSKIHKKRFTFDVDFDDLLNTSFQALHDKPPEILLNDFHIRVENSPVVDAGGVTRTWFTLLAKELFNQNYGIFDCSKDMRGYRPSCNSFIHKNHLEYFKFAGIFIARALIEGVSIDAHLSSSFCKQILHRKTNLKDLEDIDGATYRSSLSILENDANQLYLTFSMNIDDFGEIKTIELKENGSKIPVTNENKVEFINLKTNYILNVQIQEQISAFNNGFDSLLPHEFLRIFTPNELDLLICGVPSIDVNDFKENMTYIYPYNENTPVVKLFFEVIEKWGNEDLAKLLLFMTGSSRVPINGFKEFAEITGHKLQIGPGGKRENWPQSHTCFNELDLPEYQTKEELETLLRRSIEYNNSFGII